MVKWIVLVVAISGLIAGCVKERVEHYPLPVTVEVPVTREVEVTVEIPMATVEVTRVVEVTRIVEVVREVNVSDFQETMRAHNTMCSGGFASNNAGRSKRAHCSELLELAEKLAKE